MKISIIGLGRFGALLSKSCLDRQFEVAGTTRTPHKQHLFNQMGIKTILLDYPSTPDEILDAEIIILNIPPFENQLSWFKSWSWDYNKWLIFISSTSVIPVPDSAGGEILKAQEDWVLEHYNAPTILRFGGLYSESMHPGKYLSGRKNLKGRLWPVNLIHLDDTVGATLAVIDQKIRGKVLNVVADEHPTREEYYTNYCLKNHLPIPEFDPTDFSIGKVVYNDELKKIYLPQKPL